VSTIRRQSTKQGARERARSERKRAWIRAELGEKGYVACQCGRNDCGRIFVDEVNAMYALQGHHPRKRSLGGRDEDEVYCTIECHRREHRDMGS
jgi:hypothetical protein